MTTRTSLRVWGCILIFLFTTQAGWSQAIESIAKKTAQGQRVTVALAAVEDKRDFDWTKPLMTSAFEDALLKAGRFKVLSRSELDKALGEQKLADTGMIDPASAVKIGKVLAANYVLVVRQIMDMKQTKQGFGPVSRTVTTVAPNLQAQIIDVESGELIQSQQFSKSFELKSISIKQSDLQKDTSLTVPYRAALDEFAGKFTSSMATAVPLELLVVAVSNGRIALQADAELAIRPGTEFELASEGKAIMSPAGVVLGYDRKTIGRMTVVTVEAKLVWGRVVKTFNDAGGEDSSPDIGKVKENMIARSVPKN